MLVMDRVTLRDLKSQLTLERSAMVSGNCHTNIELIVAENPLERQVNDDIAEKKKHLRSMEDESVLSLVDLRIAHDQKLHNLRREYDDKIRNLAALHNQARCSMNQKFEAIESANVAVIESESRARLDSAILEQSNRLASQQAEGSAAVETLTKRLSVLKAERLELKRALQVQESKLDALRRKVSENGAPIAALEAKIFQLENHTSRFRLEVAPALVSLKREVKELRVQIAERSLFLECLLQRRTVSDSALIDKSGLVEAIEKIFLSLSCDAETVCSDT